MSKKMAALKKIAVPIDYAYVGPSNAIEAYKQCRLHLQPPADKSILKWKQKKEMGGQLYCRNGGTRCS